MSWIKGRFQYILLLGCSLLIMGCSHLSHEASGIPEIQGVWRHSTAKMPSLERSLTFEFQQDKFRVSGYPHIYARGSYDFTMSSRGGYEVALMPEESRNFELRSILVQPTGGRILLIDRLIYRKILRQ
ncbi:MAG TPA: hypothetical protein PLM98_06485 [Thiolinea sp.]|nr:hypothetical protein [Thiolinea sp.]